METLAATRLTYTAPRTNDVVRRMFWKELRVLRGLAIGVVFLAYLAIAVMLIVFVTGRSAAPMLLGAAFASAALFVIGAAVMLFAAERDEGTVALLQLLPQNRPAVLFGKLTAAVAMTLVVLAIVSLPAVARTEALARDSAMTQAILLQGFVFLFEAFAWGVLVSLLCPNPLLAAVLGIAAASFSPQLAMWLTVRNAAGFTLDEYQAATSGRLGLAAIAGAIDVWLGLRWLGKTEGATSKPRWWERVSGRAMDAASSPAVYGPPRLRVFAPLLWQTIRQSWKAIVAAIAVSLFLSWSVELPFRVGGRSFLPIIKQFDLPLSLLFLPALIGALTFRADQRGRQFRFLAEHAGRPRALWAARQAFGLAAVIALGAIVHAACWSGFVSWLFIRLSWLTHGVQSFGIDPESRWTYGAEVHFAHFFDFAMQVTVAGWIAWLTAYAVGQWFSLTVRSAVLAGMLSLGMSVILLLWTYVVIAWQLSPLLFVLPILIGMLAGSWLRVKDWMIERNTISRWLLSAGVVVVPMVLMFSSVPAARLAQVSGSLPPVDGQANLTFLSNQALQESTIGGGVMDRYFTLASNLPEPGVASGGEFDEEIRSLSKEHCRLPVSMQDANERRVQEVISHAHDRAKQLLETDLDAALEMLLAGKRIEYQSRRGLRAMQMANVARWRPRELHPHWLEWATAQGQTAERLKQAINELREIDRLCPTPTDGVVNDYLKARRVVRGARSPSFLELEHRHLRNWLAYLAHELPGEAERAEKSLDLLAAEAVDFTFRARTLVDLGDARWLYRATWRRELLRRFRTRTQYEYAIVPLEYSLEMRTDGDRERVVTPERLKLNMAAQTSYLAVHELGFVNELPDYAAKWVASIARQRAERTRLALIAYRLEHGEYPATLDALSPEYLSQVEYHDPYAAGPLQYRREGFEVPGVYSTDRGKHDGIVPPRTPVLWSIGEGNAEPVERNQLIGRTTTGEYIIPERNAVNNEPSDIDWQEKFIQLMWSEFPTFEGMVVLTLPTELEGELQD